MRSLAILSLVFLAACSGPSTRPDTPVDAAVSGATSLNGPSVQPTARAPFSFEASGVTLHGTLHFPKVDAEERVRLPGVVIAHDFGPIGRDGIMRHAFGVDLPLEVAVYRSIAEHLASRGFVVLTYDKRTCVIGGAVGCEYPRSYLDGHQDSLGDVLLSDLNAAVEALKARPEVDQARMTVIGHGHGADLAMALQTPLWKRVIIGWTPLSPSEIITYQLDVSIQTLREVLVNRNDAEADEMKRQLARLEADRTRFREGQQRIRVGEPLDDLFGLSSTAWRSLDAIHTTAVATVNTETAFILGGRDFDIPKDTEDRLRAMGADQNIILLPTMGHLMVDLEADTTVVSAELVDALLAWMLE